MVGVAEEPLNHMDIQKIGELAISFFAGATISAAVTFQITKNIFRKTQVNQTRNNAGRDIIGGDRSGR